MMLRPPRSTRTYTLFPYTTLFRSARVVALDHADGVTEHHRLPRRCALSYMDNTTRCHGGRQGLLSTFPRIAMRPRSEEHTSELQSLMRISYAVFCLKKKNQTKTAFPYNITSIDLTHNTITRP